MSVKITISCLDFIPPTICEPDESLTLPAVLVLLGSKSNKSSEEEIYNNLIEIKGVGNWTIHMFLMFSYGSSNIFPTGDLGFLKAISKLYKVQPPISERKLKLLYKKWSPYSSQATWYLWRSLDPISVNY